MKAARISHPTRDGARILVAVASMALLGTSAAASAQDRLPPRSRTCIVRIMPPRLTPGDRIAALMIRSNLAVLTTLTGVPRGWSVTIANDPSSGPGRPPNSFVLQGRALIGVAYLDPAALRALTIGIARVGLADPSGNAVIANPSRRDRQVPLRLAVSTCRR